jgi:hypothetical protein
MSRVPAKVYYWKHDLFLVHSCALRKTTYLTRRSGRVDLRGRSSDWLRRGERQVRLRFFLLNPHLFPSPSLSSKERCLLPSHRAPSALSPTQTVRPSCRRDQTGRARS